MKPLRRLTNLLAACAVAAAALIQPALAADLAQDPFITDNAQRQHYEPGGKYHLFGDPRGSVSDRTGKINVIQDYTHQMGNLLIQQANINGTIGTTPAFPDTDTKNTPPSTTTPPTARAKKKATLTKALPYTGSTGKDTNIIPPMPTTARRAAITPNLRAHETNTPITSTAQPAVSNSIRPTPAASGNAYPTITATSAAISPTAPMKPTEKCSSTMPSSTAGATAWSLSTASPPARSTPLS
ncbi:hypothetical protein NM2002020_0367, partial [Neisseria meningitidis 2002020]